MKKLTKVFAALLATAAIGIMASCSDGNDNNAFTYYNAINNLKYLDLANAKSVYISGSSGTSANKASKALADTQKMFKITKEGYVQEVKCLDANKNEITITQKPTAIHPINDDYICVGFGWNVGDMSTCYLVRKSDGAVFDMKNAGIPEESSAWTNGNLFHTDKKNNMYFIVDDYSNGQYLNKVVRVNLSGVDSLSSETVTPSTDYVYNFDVDGQGNIIYFAGAAAGDCVRIRKTNGGLKNISVDACYNLKFWIGFDGNIYYCDNDNGCQIKKIVIDNAGNITESLYGDINSTYGSVRIYDGYKLEIKNRIIIIDDSIKEVYNPSSSPREVSPTGLDLKSVIAVDSTENFYYIAGKDSSGNAFLVKIDPDTDTCSNILADNNYEVYTFTASETDGITFNALRMSDGKKIIGKVGINGGAVTVIDQESDMQISYLERIN